MEPIWVAVILVALVIVALAGGKGKRKRQPIDRSIYRHRKYLLSKAEKSFYGVLVQATQPKNVVLPKVRVADVLYPRKGLTRSARQTAFNQIQSKHFDFVICHSDSMTILCVVELDDRSHDRPERIARDKFLQDACKSCDLRLVRIRARNAYSVQEVRAKVLGHEDA